MIDILFIILFLGLLLIPFIWKKMWYWVGTISAMGVCLGIGELLSKNMTGMTLSKTFWVFSLEYPVQAWIILGCMLSAWFLLMLHLSWKMLKKKVENGEKH